MTPEQRRAAEIELELLRRQQRPATAGTGDTLIDAGTNLWRGLREGFNAPLESGGVGAALRGMAGDPAAQQRLGIYQGPQAEPPVGSGMGFRTGQSIGRTLPALPLGGVAGQLALGAGGGVVAEGVQGMTGSALAGNMAELGTNVGVMAGPMVARQLFRGSGNAANVAGEVADRAITGVNTGVGPATQGRTVPDTLQSIAEKIPGGRGVMQNFMRRVGDDFQRATDRFTGLLGRQAQSADDFTAGIKVKRGIERSRGVIDTRMGQLVSRIGVQPDAPVELSAVQRVLNELGGKATGIPELDALATSPAMTAAQGAMGAGGFPPTSYAAALRLRSKVGERLRGAGLTSNITTGESKLLYGALTDDIGRTVEQQAGPQGKALWDQSRRYWHTQMRRLEDDLQTIADMTDPVNVTAYVQRSPKTLAILRRQISPEAYDTLVAATFNDMGQAVNSAQNAAGTVWSLESFLTKWNKLGSRSRDALLAGPRYAQAREGLNALARQAERVREINQRISNAGGTSRGMADIMAAGAPLAGLAAGKIWPAVAAGLAVGGSYGSARLMTNPQFLQWMNKSLTLPVGQTAGAALRLSGMIRDGGWTPEEAQTAADIAVRIQQGGQQ